MFEKLSFRDLIRFFFSGCVTWVAVASMAQVSMADVLEWLRANEWATDFSPTAVMGSLTLMLGYITFTLYRTVAYDWGILRIKGILSRRFKRCYDYRCLIQDMMFALHEHKITNSEAERLYLIVRRVLDADYYKKTAPDTDTGLHFLYLLSIVAAFASVLTHQWSFLAIAVAAGAMTLALDMHHERDELLIFLSQKDKLSEQLKKFPVMPSHLGEPTLALPLDKAKLRARRS